VVIPNRAAQRATEITIQEVDLRKFVFRKRVVSAILAVITSVLLAAYPEQVLDILKIICKHLVVCPHPDTQADGKEMK
jgi:hypothetical protein